VRLLSISLAYTGREATCLIAPIGAWIAIIGIRIWVWIREANPDEPEPAPREEASIVKETTASKEAVMEAAIVKSETTTA
jgi:hypothetical protein